MAEDKLTLTQFMDISRKTLVISVVVMMVIMIGNLAVQIYQAAIRPAYIHIGEQPGMGFGFLPVTRFPDSVVNPHSLSYALNFNGSSDSSLLPRFGVVNN
ncbi:MAG: hypothetical protein LBG64_03150, partial [Pseudomonadales bacterium]|nr:hypothetical protein [Pseudomonadales bacterium]